MKCLFCSHQKTSIVNSRSVQDGASTWRRRHCSSCKNLFTTRESTLADNLFVIKRSGHRQRFVYEKLFASIFTAVNARKDRDNGDDAKTAKRVAYQILGDVFARFIREDNAVSTRTLILLTYTRLQTLRPALAENYVHYSDHRLRIARGPRS